jgi:hypothetical protein
MKTITLIGATCGLFAVSAIFLSSANADTDACGLLTQAQVAAAAGFTVEKGTHVTPTFLKTCTWTGSNASGVQVVTLNLQTAAFFDGSKKQAALMAAAGGALKPAGVGDDSYYAVLGDQVALWVKRGGNAFKVAVYKKIPVGQKEGIELALARQVVPKL